MEDVKKDAGVAIAMDIMMTSERRRAERGACFKMFLQH